MSNLNNSIQFLVSAREAISLIVKESTVDNKNALCNFIMNEASDYQVMHTLMRGELPKEKYDLYEEMNLFDEFNTMISENADTFSESFGFHAVNEMMNVGSVSQYGMDTAKPILESAIHNGLMEQVAALKAAEQANRGQIARILARVMDPTKAEAMAGTIINKAKSAAEAMKMARDYVADKLAAGGKAVAGAATAAGGAVKSGAERVGAELQVRALKGAQKMGASADTQKAIMNTSTAAIGGVAAAAVAAAAIYAGYKVYKRFFSAAAKACGGKSGSEKTACMTQYKKKALLAQANAISSGASKCAKSKDPAKCKAAIKAKADKIKAKAAKL